MMMSVVKPSMFFQFTVNIPLWKILNFVSATIHQLVNNLLVSLQHLVNGEASRTEDHIPTGLIKTQAIKVILSKYFNFPYYQVNSKSACLLNNR